MRERRSKVIRIVIVFCLFSFILRESLGIWSVLREFVLDDDDVEWIYETPVANQTWNVITKVNASYSEDRNVGRPANPPSDESRSVVEPTTIHERRRFAYAFAISGCDHDSCIGYILNVIVAAASLKHYNSTADVVIMLRMSSDVNETRLPPLQEEWLLKAGVKIRYHPKAIKEDNFGLAQMEKFRILELTDYDRVIHMDGDIIPACNLDSFIEASYGRDPVLTPYTALSGAMAPATGAFFMVRPNPSEFERIMDVVLRHRRRTHKATMFDPHIGWGHAFQGNDSWQGSSRKGRQVWDMYGAAVDQGVLYHWLKYELLNWTVITTLGEVITWQDVSFSLEQRKNQSLPSYEAPHGRCIAPVRKLPAGALKGCGAPTYGRKRYMVRPPFVDFLHYYGGFKPFIKPINASLLPFTLSSNSSTMDVWYYFLRVANSTFNLQLPSYFHFWASKSLPLGAGPEENHILSPEVELPKPLKDYECKEDQFEQFASTITVCE